MFSSPISGTIHPFHDHPRQQARMAQECISPLKRIGMNEPAPPWSLLSALVALVASFALIIAAFALVATWLGDNPALSLIAWALGGFALALYVFQSRRKEREALRLAPMRASLPLLLVINIGFAMLLDVLSLAVTRQFLPAPELTAL